MNEIDDEIREALQAEQDDLTEDEDWQVHYESLKSMFRGQQRWLTIINCSMMGVLTTTMIMSAIQFFRVESTRAMIAWATGFSVCIILEAIVEVWFFMEWNKGVVRREIKELELQVATLSRKIVAR